MIRHPNVAGRLRHWLILCLALASWSTPAQPADKRQVFSGETFPWLHAVGKLQVPGQRHKDGHTSHYLEDCSATLVSLPGRVEADIIVTAWHCLALYRDLSKPIFFTAETASGAALKRQAHRLADGGGMHADWAILGLRNAVPAQVMTALSVHPQFADSARPIIMAGYSRDIGIGDEGHVLTFDPACTIIAQDQALGETNCTAFKGASGGAVIQLFDNGEPRICGVISQGNGQGHSTYVPMDSFRNAINLHLD
jgi:hypothetical protein